MIVIPTHAITMPQKCASTYVKRVLESAFGATQVLPDRHVPLSRVPEGVIEGRRLLGITRNPWAWYVSRWRYVKKTMRSDLADFKTCLTEFITSSESIFGNRPPDIPTWTARLGAFSWQHVMYHSRSFDEFAAGAPIADVVKVDRMMKVETIRGDLMLEFGPKVQPHLKQFQNSYAKGEDWRSYYDDETRELVRQFDGDAIRAYGYEF